MTDPTISSEFSPPEGRPVAPVNDAADTGIPRDVPTAVDTGASAGAAAHDGASDITHDSLGDGEKVDNGATPANPQQSDLSPSDVSPSGRGWWRRNRIALAAILILVPVTGLAIFGNGLRTSRSVRPSDPITVKAGQTAAYSGATVGPTVATFTSDRSEAPNTRVVRVTTSIADGDELYCNGLTLRELTGAKRVWQTAFESFATDESALLYCDPTQPGPYDLQSFFVVPDDATGPFAVELYVPELLPEYVQFVVNPAADG